MTMTMAMTMTMLLGLLNELENTQGFGLETGMVETCTYGYVNSHTNHLCARQMPLGESFSYPLAIFQINTQHTQLFFPIACGKKV